MQHRAAQCGASFSGLQRTGRLELFLRNSNSCRAGFKSQKLKVRKRRRRDKAQTVYPRTANLCRQLLRSQSKFERIELARNVRRSWVEQSLRSHKYKIAGNTVLKSSRCRQLLAAPHKVKTPASARTKAGAQKNKQWLEADSPRNLQDSGVVELRCDPSECRVAESGIGAAKLHPVE